MRLNKAIKAIVVELVGLYANWFVSDSSGGRSAVAGCKYFDTIFLSSTRDMTGSMEMGRMSAG
jgi:hypothetical protein